MGGEDLFGSLINGSSLNAEMVGNELSSASLMLAAWHRAKRLVAENSSIS